MKQQTYAVIIGSGSYIPTDIVTNQDFIDHVFYDTEGKPLEKSNEQIISQFEQITGIRERRYVTDGLVASDIAFFAAREALSSAQIDAEELDYIIVAHNFGDVSTANYHSDFVPALASRVKNKLGIINPETVTYDLSSGCAGWMQGLMQANDYIRSGGASKVLIIGAETLSRVCDPHDRDTMLFADGAGAVVLAAADEGKTGGILAQKARSFTGDQAYLLKLDKSSNPNYNGNRVFLKMQGRKLYEQVIKTVPAIIKATIEQAGLNISDIAQILIHQANHKMDEAILKELFALYGLKQVPDYIMPMTISWLGNSSVATVPTLYDLFSKGEFENHAFTPGEVIVFVSVGAGINMNAVVYQIPGA